MTYQEIIKAIESLPVDEQDSLIELIRQQQQEQRQVDKSHHVVERTPEETQAGLRKIEKFMKSQQERWENMTSEEREASDYQFKMLDESLRASRGLGENWE